MEVYIVSFYDDVLNLPDGDLIFLSLEGIEKYLNEKFDKVKISHAKNFIDCYYNGILFQADITIGHYIEERITIQSKG